MPDDPKITDMDPVQKIWAYENWAADQNDDIELAKNHAYLLASFSNPEAVKQILGNDNIHESTEDEFEESSRMVREMNLKTLAPLQNTVRKRKRRIIKG
jgi:hypothetical protein